MPGSWGSDAGGGGGRQFALTTSRGDCLKMHIESSFLSFFFFQLGHLVLDTSLHALLDFFLRFKEVSFLASLHHICCFPASQRMLGISPWVA